MNITHTAHVPPFLTSSEAALRLGISIDTLKRAAHRNELPSTKTPGGHFRFRPEDVEQFAAVMAASAGAEDGAA